MSKTEPNSNLSEFRDAESNSEGAEVVMYMEASGPEECAEGYYWDGVQCVRKPELPEINH
jgi:hypothetical protein